MASERAKTKGKAAGTPAVLKLASYWIIEKTTLETIERMAEVMLNSNPQRAGAADWRQALSTAKLAQRCVAAGQADGAPTYALEAYRFANRAELLEHAAPMVARDAIAQRGRGRGGAEAGRVSRGAAAAWQAEAVKAARSMLAAGTQPRNLAGILASRYHKSARTLRTILKKAELI